MRLHTGHNRLNAHMFRKMKLAPSPTCDCSLEDQTAEYILQRCLLLQKARQNVSVANSSPTTHQTTAAGRNWRKRPHSPCSPDFQCSGDREEQAYLKHPALSPIPLILSLIPATSCGSMTVRHLGRVIISRSSLMVNATCRGPLLPTVTTRFTLLFDKASNEYSEMSVFCPKKRRTRGSEELGFMRK